MCCELREVGSDLLDFHPIKCAADALMPKKQQHIIDCLQAYKARGAQKHLQTCTCIQESQGHSVENCTFCASVALYDCNYHIDLRVLQVVQKNLLFEADLQFFCKIAGLS